MVIPDVFGVPKKSLLRLSLHSDFQHPGRVGRKRTYHTSKGSRGEVDPNWEILVCVV